MPALTAERVKEIQAMNSCFPFLMGEKHELCAAYLEHLHFDTALAQASAFAQYVSDHAKGEMVKAAERFLSTEGALYIETRVKAARTVYEGKVDPDLVEHVRNAVYATFGQSLSDDVIRCAISHTFSRLRDGT